MSIRIALAEDNELFRRGMVSVLRRVSDFDLNVVAVNGRALLDELALQEVDVVLLDIMMPEMDGIEAASIISNEYPQVRMLAITMFDQEMYLQKMLEAGVSGYVIKDIGSEELERAIRTVFGGKCYYSEVLLPLFGKMLTQKAGKTKQNKLSKREEEIVNLIAKGYSSEKIGEVLSISVKTVSNHRNNIYSKLDVQNTAELISYAYKNRILTVE
ncbi:response regulator transcription factor [uncultured Acetobacteroides sp.]|uniref:response regulator transcription factor n=1 Tax=uncultured Acetobacteroides sp. TaxID=1760811 RepID=UPI0029F5316C|nr:response regulator transcription factor [uncultured Acetobacteroides sp.]